MSMYPPGVTTALVTAGTAIDFAGTPARNITVTVTPVLGGVAKSITHEVEGGDMGISVLNYSADDTGMVQFELPHTDQPGWVDSMQRPVEGWGYRAEVTITLAGGTLKKIKNFTIPTGQERVDLDRIADGPVVLGVSAPAEVVSSVAGLTGSISRDALAEALGTVSGGGGAGEGGVYDDTELRQRVEELEDRPNPDFGQFVQQAALSSLYTAGEGAALEIRVDALEADSSGAAYDDGPLVARVEDLEETAQGLDRFVLRENAYQVSGAGRLSLAAALARGYFDPTPSPVSVNATTTTDTSALSIQNGLEINVSSLGSQLGSYTNPSMWRIEYGLAPLEVLVDCAPTADGAEFEIRGVGLNALAARTLLWIDGHPLPVVETPGAGVNVAWSLHVKFTEPGAHLVRIYQPGVAVEGIRTRDGNTMLSPAVHRPAVGVVMDSFGGSTDYVSAENTPLQVLEERLNVNLLRSTIGGSGYIAEGSWVRFAHPDRIATWANSAVDGVLFFGSINDLPGPSEPEYKAALRQTWDAYGERAAGSPIVVFGIQPSSAIVAVEDPAAARLNRWMYEAAQEHPAVTAFVDMLGTADVFTGEIQPAWELEGVYAKGDVVRYQGAHYRCIEPIQYADPRQSAFWKQVSWIYTGTGSRGEPEGDGNRDALLGEDGVHPTVLGARAFGQQIARTLVEALSSPAEFAYVN